MSTTPASATTKPQSKLDLLRAVGTTNTVADLGMARQYIRALTGSSATPMTWFAYAEKTGTRTPGVTLYGPLYEHEAALASASVAGCTVECLVNRTNGTGMTASDVVDVRALWIATNSERARFTREQVDAVRPKPDLITQVRGGEFNLFWRMDDGECSFKDFAEVMRRLALHYRSSHSVIHLEQRFRVPGFWSWCADSLPFQVDILSDRSRWQA